MPGNRKALEITHLRFFESRREERGIYPAGPCERGKAQAIPHAVLLMIVPADSSPRSLPFREERGIYPAGPCERGRAQAIPHAVLLMIVPAD